MTDPARSAWQVAYELSPIFLVNGIAKTGTAPDNTLPITLFTEGFNLIQGAMSGNSSLDYETASFHFRALPGGTLLHSTASHYPFLNQTVAANAMQREPLRFSMLMICPERKGAGMLTKTLKLSALKGVLDRHQLAGGYYNVLTPANFYTGCILLQLRDVTQQSGDNGQTQAIFQLDFEQPLVETSDAAQVWQQWMNLVSKGAKVDPGLLRVNYAKRAPDYAKRWLV